MTERRTWDKGIDFETYKRKLTEDFLSLKKKRESEQNQKEHKKLLAKEVMTAILLITLSNGARVSEGVHAFVEFVTKEGKERMFTIMAKKRGNPRPVIIPDVIKFDREYVSFLGEYAMKYGNYEKVISNTISQFCRRTYNVNTHSLRYAGITKLIEVSGSAEIAIRATGHKKLDTVVHYIQKRKAEEALERLAK